MYSETLKEILASISELSEPGQLLDLVDRGMQCYLDSIASQINGELFPPINRSDTLIQASLLSSVIANNPQLPQIEKLHYLVGMILEQQGTLLAQSYITTQMDLHPQDNDHWYLLTLAFLHYLAGGYRIQAKTIVNNLEKVSRQTQNEEYKRAFRDIKRLFSDQFNYQRDTFFIQKAKISGLINQIHAHRVANLTDLGLNNESEWLARRGIEKTAATSFWQNYLQTLSTRGITTFTREQINNDFDTWLRIDDDLLVVLPTGSGKTIIGELKTALMLANGKQVVWLLPMRSLVRQTQSEMAKAFRPLSISVQELPTTEDYVPLFFEMDFTEPVVAITTPERFLALIRAKEDVLQGIGLIVVDEAQNLFEGRGFAIESVLFQMTASNPECKIAYLSAMADKAQKIKEFHRRLRPNGQLSQIIYTNRPTRCSYGILTSLQDKNDGKQEPVLVCYPVLDNWEARERLSPRIIRLPKTKSEKFLENSTLIKIFINNSQRSNLRSVIFVNRKDSTETRALEYSREVEEVGFSEDVLLDLARIRVERGADSPFEGSYKHRMAPHHGSLPKIEQMLIEKWIKNGLLQHIIATPTLAQGVNLPFDISIITFLSRHDGNSETKLSQAEVINMLGRAGRAGMVSDGLALIAQKSSQNTNNTQAILDRYRNWFFGSAPDSSRLIGLSRILSNLLDKNFHPENWIEELSGFKFNESTALNILLAKVIRQNPEGDFESKLKDEIQKYPSINDLQTSLGVEDIPAFFAGILFPIIQRLSSYPPKVLEVMSRTGLPAEFVNYLIENLRTVNLNDIDQPLNFANELIERVLVSCSARNWLVNLRKINSKSFELNEGFTAINHWISGSTWNEINAVFTNSFKNNLILTGSFLNYTISQIAQFWGCLAICEKVLFSPDSHYFDLLQPFVRNGVNSRRKLMVLKEIGYLDRVLAHKIAPYFDLDDEDSIIDMQLTIQRQLNLWKNNMELIPPELGLEHW